MSFLAALALLMEAPAALAGLYRTQQMEVAAALELKAYGSFRYMLDYGAVSEAAEGHWRVADGAVRLDSDPLPAALLRDLERSDAAFPGEVLARDRDALVLRRHEKLFVFRRGER